MTDTPTPIRSFPAEVYAGTLAEQIKGLVYQHAGKIPLALALGVLEIVKLELIEEADQ